MKKVISFILVFMLLSVTLVYGQGETEAVISTGDASTYVIKNDGSLWGIAYIYPGDGNSEKGTTTEFVKILDDVRSVSTTWHTRLAVKKDNTLWGWGSFSGYPAGSNDQNPYFYLPTQLAIDDVKSASATHYYVLVLKNDNTLWVCGAMMNGDGTSEKAISKDGFRKVADNVIDMYADEETVFYIKDDHTLWGYGDNNYAQLGNMESTSKDTLTPIKILDDVKKICPNYSLSGVMGAIRLDNSLYLWGERGFYTEEYGWIEDAGKPYKAMENILDASFQYKQALILKADNTLWSTGDSLEGKSIVDKQVPTKVTDNVVHIAFGKRHAAIVKSDNSLWTMGKGIGLGYVNTDGNQQLTKVFENVQDAPASWATELVDKAIGEQLIPEDMQNNYTKAITREEFCILAIRMIEVKSGMSIEDYLDEVGVKAAPIGTFDDCDTFEVRAAKSLKITKGTSENTFTPDRTLTRQEAATFLTNTALACGRDVNFSTPAYSDISSIAEWAKPFTGYVYDIDVMRGVGNNNFGPLMPYQRQQAFITMYKIWLAIDSVNPDNVDLGE